MTNVTIPLGKIPPEKLPAADMKLWRLEATDKARADDVLCGYTDTTSMIVLAVGEPTARAVAHSRIMETWGDCEATQAWLNPEYTTCVEVSMAGPARVLHQQTGTG